MTLEPKTASPPLNENIALLVPGALRFGNAGVKTLESSLIWPSKTPLSSILVPTSAVVSNNSFPPFYYRMAKKRWKSSAQLYTQDDTDNYGTSHNEEDDNSSDETNHDLSENEKEDTTDVMTVREFASRIKVPFSMSVASKRNTGKTLLISVLLMELLRQRKVDMVLVMSQTVHVNDDYAFLPERLRQKFSEATIQKLMDKQAKVPKGKREQVLLVLDDVLSDKDAEKSRYVRKLFVLSRHYDIHIILISQTSNVALSPQIKANSDYILYSRLNRHQLTALWESITNMDKRDFIAYSETNNKNFTFLCVDNTSQSNSPDEFLLKVKVSAKEAEKISPPQVSDTSDAEESSTSSSEW